MSLSPRRIILQRKRYFQNESVNLHLEDDEETQRRLSKLEKFAREELEGVPLIREKLCLLVSSLPAHEICTPQMQVRMTYKRQLNGKLDEQRTIIKTHIIHVQDTNRVFPDVVIAIISLGYIALPKVRFHDVKSYFVLPFRMLSNLSSVRCSWSMIPQICCADGYSIEICMYYHSDTSKHPT